MGCMTEKGRIRVKWVRSGIGFTKHQKEMIRNLGLHRLNEVTERADISSVRGLVAKLAHFVEIVEEKPAPAWANIPEFKVTPPPAIPQVETADRSEAEAGVPASNEGLPGGPEAATAEEEAVAAADSEAASASVASAESAEGVE